ncbi:MAG TPA: glycosyltransferase [Gemmatimonadales bacterium]|nr:glycosyltransferase [Gemmatimonadales bacterium]
MPGGIARAMGEIASCDPGLMVSTGTVPGSEAWDRTAPARVARLGLPSARLQAIQGLIRWSHESRRLAERGGARFVWAGNLKPAGYVARWVGTKLRVPYGLIVYGLDVALLQRQVARSLRRRIVARAILGRAAGAVAISGATAQRFVDLARELDLPLLGTRVRVIPLGADPTTFHPGVDPAPVAARYGIGPGPWLLTAARLVPHKGIDTALRALATLPREIGYLIAGEGPDRPRLSALVAELGLEDRVRFLGYVPDADLPGLHRLASLYVGLSREEGPEIEGFGLSLVEAASSGRPVVAAASGGIREAVADRQTGLVVPPADPVSAATAIRALLEAPTLADALGRAGRSLVESRLNWGRVVSDLAAAERAFSAGPAPRAAR